MTRERSCALPYLRVVAKLKRSLRVASGCGRTTYLLYILWKQFYRLDIFLPSDNRTNQKRTKVATKLVTLLSGGSQEDILKQTGSLVKSFQAEEREQIVKVIEGKVSIPPDHLASMKANLNLPWYQLWQISRQLKHLI